MQEIERSNYKKSRNIFVKIFKHSKFKSEKLLLEKRTSSIIRTVAKECINNSEEEIDIYNLVYHVKEIIFDYNSSEVFTYNGGLIIKNVINPLENPITINEVRSLCSVNLENEVLNMEDNIWIMKYTSVVSENGKYILFSDLNNIKDKDTTTFIIYDIKENKCIYKKDIQKHKNAVMQNINISEKYNGFIYSYFEEGIRKAYFYKF